MAGHRPRAGAIAVRHTLQRGTQLLAEPRRCGGDGHSVSEPKPSLRSATSAELRCGRDSQRVGGGGTRITSFSSRTGTPLHARNVAQAFQDALRRAGLPRQRFHDLRHAYATLMLGAGEELAVVSRSLGHADLSTAADVYAHLTPAVQERSAARMDVILRAVSG